MKTRVIILAQGNQSRLPTLAHPKQMLPLPACGGTPILYRTLRQLLMLTNNAVDTGITVVTWFPLMEHLMLHPCAVSRAVNGVGSGSDSSSQLEWTDTRFWPHVDTLSDPGNSSLKGIARYLEKTHLTALAFDRTIVLLGDVVYSWMCLRHLLYAQPSTIPLFAGTTNLSASDGELWGIRWDHVEPCSRIARETLGSALEKHPRFTDYQPGQLRRWLWEVDKYIASRDGARPWFAAVDDYTKDIDLPAHLELLPELSEAAAADDAENGVTW